VVDALKSLLLIEQTILEFNHDSEGVVRMNVSLYFMPQILADFILKFNKIYPNVQFNIDMTTVEGGNEALERYESDLFIFAHSGPVKFDSEKFVVKNLMEVETSFFASKEFIKKHNLGGSVKKEKLNNVPILSFPNYTQARKDLETMGLSSNHLIESNSTQMLINLAKNNMGLIWGPANFMDSELVKVNVTDIKIPNVIVSIKYDIKMSNKAGLAFIQSIFNI